MKVGISAMWLHSGQNARNSGLSRYARHLIDALLALPNDTQYELFIPAQYEPSITWKSTRRAWINRVDFLGLAQRVFWEHCLTSRVARRWGVDVWFSAALSIPLAKNLRRVAMVHDMIPILYPAYHSKRTVLYNNWALKYTAKHADRILTNSQATANDMMEILGAPAEKILVTPLGPGNQIPRRTPENVSDSELQSLGIPFQRYLLTLANLDPRKNLDGLLEAFAMVRELTGLTNLGLVVAGARRPSFNDAVFPMVEDMDLKEHVHFTGYVPDADLPALFARADVFVFPSFYEGFGLPVLEAMMLGTPVACSGTSSLPEVGGEAAAYFDPDNPIEMAKVIASCLDSEEKERRIRLGFEQAKQFTWERTARLTHQALAEAASATPANQTVNVVNVK